MAVQWNPWHGCRKLSPGCRHCYVYRMDERYGRDSSVITRTGDFGLPLKKNRSGVCKIPAGETVYTCFSSDFFVEEADAWRPEAWAMMRQRADLAFFFITKRIVRLHDCLPPDWGEGYPNVTICCTVENQAVAHVRLPVFRDAPIRRKLIVCSPLLEWIDMRSYLGPWVEQVIVGGESGPDARICDYAWVLDIRRQCRESGVGFHFQQTGARFLKDGRLYRIRRCLQRPQARKANIDLD